MTRPNLKFGIFLAPLHSQTENPTEALEHDLQLVSDLDDLGYDYAWIGERSSSDTGIIVSPEVLIAQAAMQTKHIRFGTGISSLTFQHPLILADHIMRLDHTTRGRVAFSIDPGALPSDSQMMGIDALKQRDMMLEALEVLIPLLRGETVTRKTDWFELDEARLQLQRYSKPSIEITVASQVSPSGARTAGIHGLGLLSIGATTPGGFNALAVNWEIYERMATRHTQQVDRNEWSLVGPMHIAETRDEAMENVRFGLGRWITYFRNVAGLSIAPGGEDPAEALVANGLAVIGTPDDAIAQIQRLEEQSGGFGTFLQMAHNWADRAETKRSYELFAAQVAPYFQNRNDNPRDSRQQAAKSQTGKAGKAGKVAKQ